MTVQSSGHTETYQMNRDKESDPRENIPDVPILSIIKAHLSAI